MHVAGTKRGLSLPLLAKTTHRLGQCLNSVKEDPKSTELGDALSDLSKVASGLGLRITSSLIIEVLREVADCNSGKLERYVGTDNKVRVGGPMQPNRLAHHLEAIQATLMSELGNVVAKTVPVDRVDYICKDSEGISIWLVDTQRSSRFQASFRELQNAGECYALGQPTAAVFHSMRALEGGLRALARAFGVDADNKNWQNIIEQIEARIRQIGRQPRTSNTVQDEKFFGNAASHLYFVKNAWRNHVAHGLSEYSDDEALGILHRSKDFIESLSPRLSEKK
jgi:hypothetical protein